MRERRRGAEGEEEEVSSFVCTCIHRTFGRSIMRIEVSPIPSDLLHRSLRSACSGMRIRESVDTHQRFRCVNISSLEISNQSLAFNATILF